MYNFSLINNMFYKLFWLCIILIINYYKEKFKTVKKPFWLLGFGIRKKIEKMYLL